MFQPSNFAFMRFRMGIYAERIIYDKQVVPMANPARRSVSSLRLQIRDYPAAVQVMRVCTV